MTLRRYQRADAVEAAEVARAAIRVTGAEAYQPDQVAAWSAWTDEPESFARLLAQGETWVVEQDGVVVAFAQRFPADYLNLLYTHPTANRQGFASQLYSVLETGAIANGVTAFMTKASHLSRPFFAKHGWQLDEREVVERDGVRIERFAMSKRLKP
ncbi:MAG: GNAT family N-acetyltransferase [Bacteroidota bacterium]